MPFNVRHKCPNCSTEFECKLEFDYPTCNKCGKTFANKGELNKHKKDCTV